MYGAPLSAWLQQASTVPAKPGPLIKHMSALPRVSTDDVQQRPEHVLHCAMSLLQRRLDCGASCAIMFINAFATAVKGHDGLMPLLLRDEGAMAHVRSALHNEALSRATYSDPRHMAQMATAQTSLQTYVPAFWARMERCDMARLPPRELTTLLHRTGVLYADVGAPPPSAALWGAFDAGVCARAAEMDAQGIANTWHACALLQARLSGAARDSLRRATLQAARRMGPQAAAITLWALAKAGEVVDEPLLGALLAAAERTAGGMAPQGVSNTLWALARLRVPLQGGLAQALLAAAERTAPEMAPQAVSNTLWALAMLGVPLRGWLFGALYDVAVHTSADMSAQAVSNTLWALATLQVELKGRLVPALLDAAERVAPEMAPQAVSNALWALATMGFMLHGTLQHALCAAAVRVSGEMSPQAVSNTLWALARLEQQPSEELEDALVAAALRQCAHMTSQAVATTAWALATLRMRVPQALLTAIEAGMARHGGGMTPPQVAMAMHAYTMWRRAPPLAVIDALSASIASASYAQMEHGFSAGGIVEACASLQLQLSADAQQALCEGIVRSAPQQHVNALRPVHAALRQLPWPSCDAALAALQAPVGGSSVIDVQTADGTDSLM